MVTRSAYESYHQSVSIPFVWGKDSLAGVFYDKTALLIPVKLQNIDKIFLMQFDLGSPRTYFYGKTLQALNHRYPQNKIAIQKIKKKQFVENIDLNFNIQSIKLSGKTPILQTMGDSTLDKENCIIGTLGYDFIKGKIITMDYPNQKMVLSDSVTIDHSQASYLKASTQYFPIIIKMKVDNVERNMMFDTGSSLFALVTTNKKFKNIESAENNHIDSLCCIQAWGKNYSFFSKKLKHPLILGKDTLFSQTMLTTERETFKADIGFGVIGIYGITGNALFWDKKIIIDTKSNRFVCFKKE